MKNKKQIRFYPENNTYYDLGASMFISKPVLYNFLDNGIKLLVTTAKKEDITNKVYADYLKENYNKYNSESIFKTLRRTLC